ncbi:hypothetical protein A6F58_00850 [Prescottella equi]|nr:hypothetical protein A6F58_00850 [Prescottella equi]
MIPKFDGAALVESDDDAHLYVDAGHAHETFVKIVAEDGSIHLFPFAHLEPGERALFENAELYRDTAEALAEFTSGGGNSTDWLFDDDE